MNLCLTIWHSSVHYDGTREDNISTSLSLGFKSRKQSFVPFFQACVGRPGISFPPCPNNGNNGVEGVKIPRRTHLSSGIKLNFLDPTPSSSLCPWHLFSTLCLMHLRNLVQHHSYLQCGAKEVFHFRILELFPVWLHESGCSKS